MHSADVLIPYPFSKKNDRCSFLIKYHGEHLFFKVDRDYGYREISDPIIGFRLNRWLCALSWTGTDRPSVLFDRAKSWLLTNKVLLPGVSTLERQISRVRSRMAARVWRLLVQGVSDQQKKSLEELLNVPDDSRHSLLNRLRSGPVRVSAPALVKAVARLKEVRNLGIQLPASKIPHLRLAALARIVTTSKVTAIIRLPKDQRLATLIAFIHCLEATANDDALDVLSMFLKELFGKAEKENRKSRLRTLKDLDKAALLWADAGEILFNDSLPENNLRSQIFSRYPRKVLEQARIEIKNLVQPPDDIYFRELERHYRGVRSFLPAVLKGLNFESNSKGQALLKAFNWLKFNDPDDQSIQEAPREVIQKPWERYVIREDKSLDFRAYTFCVLKELHTALNRRDVFVPSSWRYTDPRSGLLKGQEWQDTRPIISRTLGLPEDPKPILASLTKELDQTYRAVIARLPHNQAVRFEKVKGKSELVLTPLEELEEPKSLTALKDAVEALMPQIDLPELILEIAAHTGFTDSFTHIRGSEHKLAENRVKDGLNT